MSKGTADTTAGSPPYVGVDASEWQTMVARGTSRGVLHADEIAHVLREIELTPDVLLEVHNILASNGITIDDGVEEFPDETPPTGAERQRSVEVEDTEGLLARRRRRRNDRMSADGGSDVGNTADTVRMYLKEIGRVDLLTTDDERRLAQAIDEGHRAAATIDARPVQVDLSFVRVTLRTHVPICTDQILVN